jgi:hypothetical protein
MWIKTKKKEVIGGTVTVIAIVIAIIAVPPEIWEENFTKWYSFIVSKSNYLFTLVVGILISVIIIYARNRKKNNFMLCIISDDEYKDDFQKLLKSGNFPIVKIFGYTGEVVNNDLITYLDRYHSGIEIRYLHRNWIIEERDENIHNKIIKGTGIRLWNKSEAIKKTAFEGWNYTLIRTIRYYEHQPIIKGVIFCDRNQKPIIAYVNFQKWEPAPANGGSVFKSVPSDMIEINSKTNSKFQELIERINSQFEYEWHYGDTKERIYTKNSVNNRKKGVDYANE